MTADAATSDAAAFDGQPATPDGGGEVQQRIDTTVFLTTTSLTHSTGGVVVNGLELSSLSVIGLDQLTLDALASTEEVSAGITVGQVNREALAYVYSCAMPAGTRMQLELGGESWVFEGEVGLAPEWADNACGVECQEWVSACVLARTNAFAKNVVISMRGDHPALAATPEVEAEYSLREGSFYGNLFQGQLAGNAFACAGGRGSSMPELTDRFCSTIGDSCAVTTVADCNIDAFSCDASFPACSSLTACSAWDGSSHPTQCHSSAYVCGTTPPVQSYQHIITVYLKPPAQVCGNGICEEAEADRCPADCAGHWAQRFGSGCHEDSAGVVVDATDAVGIAGRFVGDIDFGAGPLSTADDSDLDLFAAKLDSTGAPLWSRRFDSAGSNAMVTGVDADSAGNLVITGFFEEATDLGDGLVTPTVGTTFFVAKYSAASGAHLWSRTFESTRLLGVPLANMPQPHVAVDANDNVIVASSFYGTLDLTVGQAITSDSLFLADSFVMQLGADGTVTWRQHITGSGVEVVNAVDVDVNGNVVVAGEFSDAVEFRPSKKLFSSGPNDDDMFVARYLSDGTFDWSQRIGGSTGGDSASAVAVATDGSLLVGGLFRGTVRVGATDLTSTFNSIAGSFSADAIVASYAADGTPLWGRSFGGIRSDAVLVAAWNGVDNYVIGAQVADQTIVEGEAVDAGEFGDLVLVRYRADGQPLHVSRRGSPVREMARGIDALGDRVVLAGEFMGTLKFTGTYLTNSGGSSSSARPADLFVTWIDSL